MTATLWCLALLFVSLFWIIDLFCDKFQLFAAASFQRPVKAGFVAHMTLAGIDSQFQYQAVLVTIDQYLFDLLDVATFLALFP